MVGVTAGLAAQAPTAPPAAPPPGPVHLVTYLEVVPPAGERAAAALRRYRGAARRAPGNLRVEALRALTRPGHFALVEAWRDQAALDAHRASPRRAEITDVVAQDGVAPPDERLLKNTIAAGLTTDVDPAGAVWVLTHADALPPATRGSSLLLPLAERSRTEPGCLRFDVLVQPTRLNHFTVVEVWRNRKALEAHVAAPYTRAFRAEFLKVTGALYDERLYSAIR